MTQLQALEGKPAAEDQTNWVTAFFMAAFHIGAFAALFFFTWKAALVAIFLWWISGSLGIGMGYHRLLTHRGYRTPKWVEYFLTICAAKLLVLVTEVNRLLTEKEQLLTASQSAEMRRTWRDIAREIDRELDVKKMLTLSAELNQALLEEERQKVLRSLGRTASAL